MTTPVVIDPELKDDEWSFKTGPVQFVPGRRTMSCPVCLCRAWCEGTIISLSCWRADCPNEEIKRIPESETDGT